MSINSIMQQITNTSSRYHYRCNETAAVTFLHLGNYLNKKYDDSINFFIYDTKEALKFISKLKSKLAMVCFYLRGLEHSFVLYNNLIIDSHLESRAPGCRNYDLESFEQLLLNPTLESWNKVFDCNEIEAFDDTNDFQIEVTFH